MPNCLTCDSAVNCLTCASPYSLFDEDNDQTHEKCILCNNSKQKNKEKNIDWFINKTI